MLYASTPKEGWTSLSQKFTVEITANIYLNTFFSKLGLKFLKSIEWMVITHANVFKWYAR